MKGSHNQDTSNTTEQDDIVSIMRDIAAGRKNGLGDYWHNSFCDKAADMIETLEAEVFRITVKYNANRIALEKLKNEK